MCRQKTPVQFLNQLWVVPFCNFSQTCANKRKMSSLLKFITHLAIIYMVGKQMKRVLAQKCYRHILASKPTPIQITSNNWAFFCRGGDVEDFFRRKYFSFLPTLEVSSIATNFVPLGQTKNNCKKEYKKEFVPNTSWQKCTWQGCKAEYLFNICLYLFNICLIFI